MVSKPLVLSDAFCFSVRDWIIQCTLGVDCEWVGGWVGGCGGITCALGNCVDAIYGRVILGMYQQLSRRRGEVLLKDVGWIKFNSFRRVVTLSSVGAGIPQDDPQLHVI